MRFQCAVAMSERVQSPAALMTRLFVVVVEEVLLLLLLGSREEGNVAKGCHSRSGEEERTRQEYLWTGFGKESWSACGESGVAVKVQRRRRSHG